MESFERLHPDDVCPRARGALRAWLALQRRFVFRPLEARAALAREPDPRRILQADGAPPLASEAEVAALRASGAALVPFGSPLYPQRLARLADAPAVLLVRGDPAVLSSPAVAVVGARAATAYGRANARRFAEAFAEAGLAVVSGLATGIDGEAHAAALARGGRSLGVQACGPERVYPARHVRLAQRVAASGAVVTEFPTGTPPRAPHFPLRNRIISALSRAVLVVEARLRSGSLVTARHAADQGVDVWALPGPIGVPTSEGTNRLLADGAQPALSPEEMLAGLADAGVPLCPRSAAAPAGGAPSPAAERLLAALRDVPRSRDALCRALALAPGELAPQLLELELAGWVREDRDGRFCIISPLRERELS
ncbi:MAG: DNA-protecting protein DprA [Deltaproteobacteria bacterium]|nr:DNA-protecting protein DprA [Deltaproteobacteria bacterium]